ncbi:hypothetical protein [Pleionea sediminis]|uniref:hypothetical protein n=1 Tax=Pleionea sediminis TaxID=2569479 RepID=UPI00118652E7|nr:hypothetical protein [Pleionea sediminis]
MKLIRKSRLKFQQGKSDKVYEVDLVKTSAEGDNAYLVNFRYGRRGSNLREGTKTPDPVDFAKAEKLFDSIVISKINKGYIDSESHSQSNNATSRQSNRQSSGSLLELAADNYNQRIVKLMAGSLNDHQAKRLVWRLGEMGYQPAISELIQLIGKKDDAFNYVLAWSLGRLNAEAAFNTLLDLSKTSRSSATQRIALEAALNVANKEDRESLLKDIYNQLPSEIKSILSRSGVYSNDISTSQSNLSDTTNDIFRYFESTPEAIDLSLVIFYQLGLSSQENTSYVGRHLVKEALARFSLAPNYFVAIRHVFKLAEFRLDGEIYGLIAQKFDRTKEFYFISDWSDFTVIQSPSYQWVNIQEEQSKSNPRLAYSNKTRRYFRRRCWRTLRRLGEAHDSRYVTFAADILLTYNDLCAEKPQTRTQYQYDAKTRQSHATTAEYDEYASQNLLCHLTRANHPGFKPSNSYKVWQKENTQSAFTGRGEAFPELWDENPEALLKLLCHSKLTLIQEFCARALQDHPSFCAELSFEVLCQLLSSEALAAQTLAVEIIKPRLHREEPTSSLLSNLIACQIQDGRKLAMDWMRSHLTRINDFIDVFPSLLFVDYEDVQEWLCNIAIYLHDSEKGSFIVDSVLNKAAEYYSTNHEEAALIPIFERLLKNFKSTIETLELTKIQDLFEQPGLALHVFAAKLLEVNQCPVESIPPQIFKGLIDSSVISLQSSGVALYSKLPSSRIAEQLDLLVRFCISSSPSVRLATTQAVEKLLRDHPTKAQELHRQLIDCLFSAETFDGVHNDLITLLTQPLDELSKRIDHQLFWRLSQAKSLGAKRFAASIINNFEDKHFSIRQWAILANQESKSIRDRAMTYFSNNVETIKAELVDALPLLNCTWEDSKTFALNYFKTQFDSSDWTPEVLVGICDNTDHELQNLGRDLILNHFDKSQGKFYLNCLSQHPSVNVQLFVTQLLPDFAGNDLESLQNLELYFITVLSQVKKGRVAKNRVLRFLMEKAQSNIDYATLTAKILTRVSDTSAVQEKAQYLMAMRDLKVMYADLKLPIQWNSLSNKTDDNNKRIAQENAETTS